MRNMTIGAIILSLVLVGSAATSAYAQDVGADIARVEARLSSGKASHLDIISPHNYQEAAKKLSEAEKKARKGGRIQDIRKRLDEAEAYMTKAEALEEIGKVLLKDALQAWTDALDANAPEFAAEEWARARSKMVEAGRKVESGEQNGARKKAAEATQKLRVAELQAIRKDLLGRARQLREEAIANEADERASATFREAESLLKQADQILRGDRYRFAEVKSLARAASEEFRHASYIAAVHKAVERKDRETVEALIRGHEMLLSEIADALGLETSYAEGMEPVAQNTLAAVNALLEDRKNLQDDLAARDEELNRAREAAEKLDARLAELEDREQTLTAEMRRREQHQGTLREVSRLFTKDEAIVVQSGDHLVIRLSGIGFPAGSSEIQPEDFSLLTKVQQALRKFPDTRFVVEGHTDSQGDTEFNYVLSRKRADAVVAYLVANMGIEPDRISSLGFGEGRPIASNESTEGRAKNRRIDVRIMAVQ